MKNMQSEAKVLSIYVAENAQMLTLLYLININDL